jgi:hypothetical protein
MKLFHALLLPLVCAALAAAAHCAPLPDDEARFLAGLPVRNTPLESLSSSAAWAAHASEFDHAWAQLDKGQLQPIQAWSPGALGHFYTDKSPLIYFFSGPDFLYAHAFFPNASTYVLCGIEPIGPLPQVENLPPETLAGSLATLRDSLDSILNFSFFITKKMKVQLEDSRLSGTLPVIYIFLARTGCHIRDVSFIGLDPSGQITTARSLAPAVKIDFTSPAGQEQTLYYFCTDLSDGPVDRSGFLTWCASLGPASGFLKAASYLMHNGGFDGSRKFLLNDCDGILQDDSGIPMHYFPEHEWDVHLFGNYSGPIPLFKQFLQPEFNQLKALQKPSPLPFSVGYRWHSGQSSLILAVKVTHAPAPSATPAAASGASPAAAPSAAPTAAPSASP